MQTTAVKLTLPVNTSYVIDYTHDERGVRCDDVIRGRAPTTAAEERVSGVQLLRNADIDDHGRYDTLYTFWDVETTGRNPTSVDMISVAFVITRLVPTAVQDSGEDAARTVLTFKRVAAFHSYIKPVEKIEKGAQMVHGITNEALERARTFVDVLKDVVAFFQTFATGGRSVVLIAHNGRNYDNLVMYSNMVRRKVDNIPNVFTRDLRCGGFLDTLPLLREIFKDTPKELRPTNSNGRESYALGNCYRCFCTEEDFNAHDALADTQALCDVMNSSRVTSLCSLDTIARHTSPIHAEMKRIKTKVSMAIVIQEEKQKRDGSFTNDIVYGKHQGANVSNTPVLDHNNNVPDPDAKTLSREAVPRVDRDKAVLQKLAPSDADRAAFSVTKPPLVVRVCLNCMATHTHCECSI